MPAAFSHLLLLKELQTQRSGGSRVLRQNLRDVINAHPEYAAIGSIGPDLLFFYDADWGLPNLSKVRDFYENKLRPTIERVSGIYDRMRNRADDILNDITGGLWRDAERIIRLAIDDIRVIMIDLVDQSTLVDFFDLATPKIYSDYNNESNWSWIDLAHHRKSGDLARELWRLSSGRPEFLAYTLGYISHIFGDVYGHAYINRLVGGPYRHHWRRHIFVEKTLDAQLWKNVTGNSLGKSNAFREFCLGSTEHPELPDDLADMLQSAFENTYGTFNLGSGTPNSNDYKLMYSFFTKWLKLASTSELEDPGPPPGRIRSLPQELRDAIGNLFNQGNINDFSPQGDVRDIKSQLQSVVRRIGRLLKALETFLLALARIIATLAIELVRLALWVIATLLYQIYIQAMYGLAVSAYIHPLDYHREHMGIDNMIDPSRSRNALYPSDIDMYLNFPQTRPDKDDPAWSRVKKMQVYHLAHPMRLRSDLGLEPTDTRPIPDSLNTSFRSLLLGVNENEASSGLAFDHILTSNVTALRDRCDTMWQHSPMSAADSLIIFLNEHNDVTGLPNFNLDADRGFSWKSWKVTGPGWPTTDGEFTIS